MPLNARDALAARGDGYAWSSSPTRGSGTLHRRNASSGDAASGQQLPRFSQLEYEKTGKRRNGVYAFCYSIAKHAHRRPRLVLLILIGIALSLALWSNGATGVLSSQSAPKRDVHHDALPGNAPSTLDLNPRPVARRPSGRTDEKYMAYFPHSVSGLAYPVIDSVCHASHC